MDFDFDEGQVMLRDSLRRLLEREYDFATRQAILREGGFSARSWQRLAELGVLGLPFAEIDGGSGGGPVDVMVVMEEWGRALALEPYAAVVVMAGGLLRDAASPQLRAQWLPRIARGEALLALAHDEPGARYVRACVATRARSSGGAHVLSGAKAVVPAGPHVDAFIVPARVESDGGIALYLVPRDAPGLALRPYRTHDGATAADLLLQEVSVTAHACVVPHEQGMAALERALDQGVAALCAEAVGAMEKLLELTVEYLITRTQFGVPIGSFQALRHRVADMRIQVELARSMSYYATLKLDAADAQERTRAVAAAKVQIGEAARFVGQQAVQLHGGIGITDEYLGSHYFKRLTMIELSLGDVDYHLGRFADAMPAA